MFSQSAQIYDAVYSAKDYADEARRLKVFIAEHKRSAGNTLLDIACGTGGHVPYLRDEFAYEGVDLDPQMLAIARERNPGIVFHQGDMCDFDLGRQFDVVTCLFSSIGYAGVVEKLEQAIATMARHLLPGGVLLVGPFFSPEAWHVRQPHAMFSRSAKSQDRADECQRAARQHRPARLPRIWLPRLKVSSISRSITN